jgi:FtsP/CotA-like multicopper oxidase with cupredoxin domain
VRRPAIPVDLIRELLSQLRAAAVFMLFCSAAFAQNTTADLCPRAEAGSVLSSPFDIRSHDGVLELSLSFRNFLDAAGQMRYCYLSDDGIQSPTLRVHPGDLLILHLKNNLTIPSQVNTAQDHMMADACGGGTMSEAATNLHFHGLIIPPTCHQDDTLKTLIQPKDPSFEYRVRIPQDQLPGLYWYHPHPHGFSEAQVLGGASGALIVEGIERANRLITGLPERVLVIRDQRVRSAILDPKKPGKDLSLNFVPVPYPDYPAAVIPMRPSERQFWRVLNASADTYVDLKLLFGGKPQFLGMIAFDGVPIGYEDGRARNHVLWASHIALPPAGRAEFVVNGPPEGVQANLVTQAVLTGPIADGGASTGTLAVNRGTGSPNHSEGEDDDNSPPRPLATIMTSSTAPEPPSALSAWATPLPVPRLAPLANVQPVRQRTLYFSEEAQDPRNPNGPTIFYITEEGKTPKPFDPNSAAPDIVVHQGDVEEWTIENRSRETHTFHIHQTHFIVVASHGVPIDQPYLRDTVNVQFWNGSSPQYPSVKLRIDFRDPNIIGTFPYHCHILQHEDGGMMGTIRVEPAVQPVGRRVSTPIAPRTQPFPVSQTLKSKFH